MHLRAFPRKSKESFSARKHAYTRDGSFSSLHNYLPSNLLHVCHDQPTLERNRSVKPTPLLANFVQPPPLDVVSFPLATSLLSTWCCPYNSINIRTICSTYIPLLLCFPPTRARPIALCFLFDYVHLEQLSGWLVAAATMVPTMAQCPRFPPRTLRTPPRRIRQEGDRLALSLRPRPRRKAAQLRGGGGGGAWGDKVEQSVGITEELLVV